MGKEENPQVKASVASTTCQLCTSKRVFGGVEAYLTCNLVELSATMFPPVNSAKVNTSAYLI